MEICADTRERHAVCLRRQRAACQTEERAFGVAGGRAAQSLLTSTKYDEKVRNEQADLGFVYDAIKLRGCTCYGVLRPGGTC